MTAPEEGDHHVRAVFTPEFAAAVIREVHDRQCGQRGEEHTAWCQGRWVRHTRGWDAAVRHLQARPRDAHGARRLLHDRMCISGADCGDADGHARRTQATSVAALRAVLARFDGPIFTEEGAADG